MLSAATFPAATARITVAGPETASPPANRFPRPGMLVDRSAWMAPRWVVTPMASKGLVTMDWPMATIRMSQGNRRSGRSAFMGFGRSFPL